MALTPTQVVDLYGRRASWYDLTANLYYLIGFREQAYRKRAIDSLGLRPGDTVVEIGCGTGLNFPVLQRAVGPTGRIIGVDLTDAMLAKAESRVRREGWANVQLVRCDAASYAHPSPVDGVLSTFALTLVPEFDAVIERGVAALAPAGRFVILDFKLPDRAPAWLTRLGVWITRPFGVTLDLADRHPWESLGRYADAWTIEELYWGFAYVATGFRTGS